MKHIFLSCCLCACFLGAEAQSKFRLGVEAQAGITFTGAGERRAGSSIQDDPYVGPEWGLFGLAHYRAAHWLEIRTGIGFSQAYYRQRWSNLVFETDIMAGTTSSMYRTAALATLNIPLGIDLTLMPRWSLGAVVDYGWFIDSRLTRRTCYGDGSQERGNRAIEGLPNGRWAVAGHLQYRFPGNRYSVRAYTQKLFDQYEFEYFFTKRVLRSTGIAVERRF